MSDLNKFTPGPWVRSSESPKIIMSGSFIDGHDGYIIGSVTGDDNSGYYASEEEAAANADLMIAAPDLLEALEALEAILPFIPVTTASEGGAAKYSENVKAADMVRAAIAKARGQS